ncbi:MAG: metal transporter [Thermodesulfobacteriota bacterium]
MTNFSWKPLDKNFLNDAVEKALSASSHAISASANGMAAFSKYAVDFYIPYLISTVYFQHVENAKTLKASPLETVESYLGLLSFNMDLFRRATGSASDWIHRYLAIEMENAFKAALKMLSDVSNEDWIAFLKRQNELTQTLALNYPRAIEEVEKEFGFHFEREDVKKITETSRFYLYQVLPSKKGISPKKDSKPVLILPPFVLGANILAFLPGEERSYVHSFANLGIPTYIRILKDIQITEPLQVMTGEDDAKDTRYFCEVIKSNHGKAVTLNGYCQGGFSAVCDILSGELDGLVDALISCVAPMDGTRSKGLAEFLKNLPSRFNDLAYGVKTLKNGNRVADGKLMGWVYKLKSIESESPVAAFYRDLLMFATQKTESIQISKSAAAINYWLSHERYDLPLEITKMSFASYNTPITQDGTLPVKLFGKKLNFKRLAEKNIPWLICYGENDDLVEKETALAPLDYISAEVTPFPKGHVAIATSWSHPESACALHTRFGEKNSRGPVKYQLDLDQLGLKKRSRRG